MLKEFSVFGFSQYRELIRAWMQSQEPARGLLSEMSRELRCQNSHLTRVLQEKVHLTMDQAFLACRFLKLNRAESRYFMKMTEHDRAGDPEYRRQLREELNTLKKEQENFNERHQLQSIGNLEKEMLYYSSWHWIAVHFITGIERFRNPRKIGERLGLSEHSVRLTLETLERFGFVKKRGDEWTLASSSIHLPKTSPMNSVQHGNWRNRAVLKSQDHRDDGLHFTVVQALSEKDIEIIRERLLRVIDEYRQIADPSPSEELVCFALDFFRA